MRRGGGRLVLDHPLVFGGDQVLEVFLDGADGVPFEDEVGRLLRDHHLRRVRVAAQRRRDDRCVDHPQALQAPHSATGRTGYKTVVAPGRDIFRGYVSEQTHFFRGSGVEELHSVEALLVGGGEVCPALNPALR